MSRPALTAPVASTGDPPADRPPDLVAGRDTRRRSGAVLTAVVVALLALTAARITHDSPVDRSLSDPRYSLLVAQQLVEHGTVALDEHDPPEDPIQRRFVVRRGGHTYSYFPLGSSVLAAPAVLIAGWFGLDMADLEDEARLQNLLSSLVVAAIVVLAFLLARSITGRRAAVVIAGASVFGSALTSTLGTAFWNLDLVVLVEMVGLVLLVRHPMPGLGSRSVHPGAGRRRAVAVTDLAVGLCLVAAFAVRPSSVPFVIAVLGYLVVVDRRRAVVVAGAAASGLVLWTLASWMATATAVPDYYTLRRVTVGRRFSLLEALHGHLLSPSRGLLIYSPMLIAVVIALVLARRRLRHEPLAWAMVGWIVLHLLIASRATRWWAGPAFGPRILADALPAWIVLTALAWRALSRDRPGAAGPVAAGYLLLTVPAILLNSYVGLYRPAAIAWNGPLEPRVDRHPSVVFDWRHPQWLASIDSLCDRERDFLRGVIADPGEDLSPVEVGERLGARSDAVVWFGWDRPMRISRWSQCREVGMAVRLGDIDGDLDLVVHAAGDGDQRARVAVNGEQIASTTFPGSVVERRFRVPAAVWSPDGVNRIAVYLPDAASREPSDPRLLGIRLVDFSVSAP